MARQGSSPDRARVSPARGRSRIWAADRSELGAATFVMVGVLAVVMSLAFAGMVIGRYLVASHGAQQAADLAALSGAAAVQHGGAACPRVKAMAAANGAELVGCDQVGDQLDFVVTARVRVAVDAARVPGLPRAMEATAYAGVVS